ncbi:hypothetical protein J8A71_00800 [Mycoplasmopsis agalactiae]|uniref:hypothetical protein n=1 Tax=Mycoplasmopsis agalactiae TaxID=2110 RepID=UPI001F254976|nr:hypothetical protein [Mycoplasmopsis agalactiae]MCE6061452.1 hypothetical protein [Mycoplasmopsis agalactiae]
MKNRRIIFTLSSTVSVLSSFSVLSAKCGSKDEVNETSNTAKFKVLVSENTDKNKEADNKAKESSAAPIFSEKYDQILEKFKNALKLLKESHKDNEKVNKIDEIISSITVKQPYKLEQAFKLLTSLFADEIKKPDSFVPTKVPKSLYILKEFVKNKRIFIKVYKDRNYIGGNIYRAIEKYSDSFKKMFFALHSNKLLDIVTVHPNDFKGIKSTHASGTNIKLKKGKLTLEFQIGSLLEESTDLPLASEEIFEIDIEK